MDYYNNSQNFASTPSLSNPHTPKYNYPSYSVSDPRLSCAYYNTIPINPSSNPNSLQLYDLSLPPPTNVIETKTDDELWIETWLSKIGKIQINLNSTIELKSTKSTVYKNNNVQIHSVRNSLKNCVQILNDLQSLHEYLKENAATMSSTDWTKKTTEIGLIKERFSKHMLQFENVETMNKILKTVEQRKKKRNCQRNRRQRKSINMYKKREEIAKAHKEVNQWLENMKDEVERTKMEEIMKKDADCVLAEVTKKKADARKSLNLTSSLVKLRQVREHAAKQRGEKVSLEDHNAFEKVTSHLSKIWNDAINVYAKEEKSLQMTLQQNATEDNHSARMAKERRIMQEWELVFFGSRNLLTPSYYNLTVAEKDLETFIAIRKSWDTFLSAEDDNASNIPIGWVLPNSNANEDWTKYLSC
ncbi:hypothetical protein RI129_001353 [Pyrocoelia pectoralis]|uniref:Programmed cell death protein 7 n=1 Tax=Pyrocoelia pectoralis TaxID=417401 RepID=A0AAN7VVC1_9COLE